MQARVGWGLSVAVLVVAGVMAWQWRTRAHPKPPPPLQLTRVGPLRISNQTSQPITLYGEGFTPGLQLRVGAPLSKVLPLVVAGTNQAYARLPAIPLGETRTEARLSLSLLRSDGTPVPGEAALTLVNDSGFPDPTSMVASVDGRWTFAASHTTDEVVALEVGTARVIRLPALDGPSALAAWAAPDGTQWVIAAHRFSPSLRMWRTDAEAPSDPRDVPGVPYAEGLIAEGAHAWVAEHVRDTVVRLPLAGQGERLTVPVSPNPGPLAWDGAALWVGSLQTGVVERVDPEAGRVTARLQPGPGDEILGGRTEAFSQRIMGGTAPRAMVYSPSQQRLFVSSIGPNIGPNPERMEVSMNGGISVFSTAGAGGFVRHLGFGAGVPEGLALDEARGLLYVADIGLGKVRILDARALGGTTAQARGAQLAELPLPPPDDFPRARREADFGVQRRAGVEVHTGPRALALSADGKTLYVLARFTGRVLALDVKTRGKAEPVGDLILFNALTQPKRRMGQVLFYADVGRTAMSCDACHPEGHSGGVLFEKTRPLRIYRSTSLRGAHDTPPFFIPESTRSLKETALDVGSRNRFGNPALTPPEIDALALHSGTFTFLPNPFRGPDGAPPQTLVTFDGREGSPARGSALFFGKAACAQCHPPPLFTTDQEPATRGRFLDVGTPALLPLQPDWQDPTNQGFPPPPLAGGWDVFPLLTSGAGGLEVKDGALVQSEGPPLRALLERDTSGKHGAAAALTPEEREDLIAWLLTL